MENKFQDSDGMVIVKDYNTAMMVLKDPDFVVPDLVNFLDRLMDASGEDLKSLRFLVNVSPFFLEGEWHSHIRKIGSSFLSAENYQRWLPFFQEKMEELIEQLKDKESFDLVTEVDNFIVKELLRPFVGLYTKNDDDFDMKTNEMQQLIEPMLSITKLKHLNANVEYLMENMLSDNIPMIDNNVSLYQKLLEDDNSLDSEQKKAYVLIIYAAHISLAQTIVNILVNLYQYDNIITPEEFTKNANFHIWEGGLAVYIHRVATKDTKLGDIEVKAGNTVIVDIGESVRKSDSEEMKNFAFGHGRHVCLGAFLSRSIILEFIPKFIKRYPNIQVLSAEKDNSNSFAQAYCSVKVKKIN